MEKANAMSMPLAVNIVGAGRAGSTLAIGLAAAGTDVQLFCRDPSRRHHLRELFKKIGLSIALPPQLQRDPHRVLILAVPDRQLPQLAAELAVTNKESLWLHLSGILPATVLRNAANSQLPSYVGALHPLAALPDPLADPNPELARSLKPLVGALFAVDGDEQAIVIATQLAACLGGSALVVKATQRAHYHAAAAIVANDLTALLTIGLKLTADAGLPEASLRAGLLHLMQTSLDALVRVPNDLPLINGLTGAVARGDAQTLALHLRAIQDVQQKNIHLQLSAQLIAELERTAQLPDDLITALREVVSGHRDGVAAQQS